MTVSGQGKGENMERQKRRRFLINKDYQYSTILSILVVVILIIITSILATHYFLLASIVKAIDARGTMLSGGEIIDLSLRPFVVVIPILIIVLAGAFALIIFISHRTAGPLYSLKRAMQRVAEGDLSVRLTFRKNDEIHDVADAFNRMMDKLQGSGHGDR